MKRLLKILVHISFLIYLYLLFEILLNRPLGYNTPFELYIKYSVNLIPFKTIFEYFVVAFNGSFGVYTAIENLSANLLVFMPMGVYLPYYFKNNLSLKQCFKMLFGMDLFVEVIQFVLRNGNFDIDDIILNVFGGMIGYLIFKSPLGQKLYNIFFN